VAAEPVVRLFGFRPTRPAFDNVIRDWMVPAISARRGVVRAFAGRHGPDELGPRLVLSVWESREAMDVALDGSPRPGEFRPEGLDGIAEPTVEVLSPRIAYLADRTVAPPRIIRVLRGCARQGKLNQYVEETRAGVAADVAAGHGPAAFYLAEGTTAEAFVTVSVWAAWSAIELATGSDIHRPLATRRPELIDAFEATHYEAIDL
jgi:hypothetical protein